MFAQNIYNLLQSSDGDHSLGSPRDGELLQVAHAVQHYPLLRLQDRHEDQGAPEEVIT